MSTVQDSYRVMISLWFVLCFGAQGSGVEVVGRILPLEGIKGALVSS